MKASMTSQLFKAHVVSTRSDGRGFKYNFNVLMALNDNLNTEDVAAMKFLSRDLIRSSALPKDARAAELFAAIDQKFTERYVLIHILDTLLTIVGRLDLRRMFTQTSLTGSDDDCPSAASTASSPVTVSDYRLMLHSLVQSMGPQTLEEFMSALDRMGIMHLKELTDPYRLLAYLEDRKYISPVNIKLLLEATSNNDMLLDQYDILHSYHEGLTHHPPSTSHIALAAPTEYRCHTMPRGICLIIENVKFQSDTKYLESREGSETDTEALIAVFTKLCFQVKVCRNLDSKQLKERIKMTSQLDHSAHDAFVCCILSHGENGVIYGTDCQPVSITYITQRFSPQFCPSLDGKPKVFFIQACQGSSTDEAVDVSLPFTDGAEDMIPEVPSIPLSMNFDPQPASSIRTQDSNVRSSAIRDDLSDDEEEYDADGLPTAAGPQSGQRFVRQPDYLIGLATVPGYVAFRRKSKGSWYIQALCDTLAKYHKVEDLLSMLTIVNDQVSAQAQWIRGKHLVQIPLPSSTLRKKLFFRT